MDGIPVVSQLKSFVQFAAGQKESAKQTQENFSKQCPVVSQLRSFGEWVAGDSAAAQKTQIEFGHFMLNVLNGVPVVGHVKGGVHYALGEKEMGDLAMKSASHTSAVVAGGIGGMVAAGPIGAYTVGAAAGAAMDITISAVDSGIKKDFVGFGLLEPINNPRDAGKWCDAVGGVAVDALIGRAAGVVVEGVNPASGVRSGTVPALENAVAKVAIPGAVAHVYRLSNIMLKIRKFVLYILKDGKIQTIIKDKLMQFFEGSNSNANKSSQTKTGKPKSQATQTKAIEPVIEESKQNKRANKYKVENKETDDSKHVTIKMSDGCVRIFHNNKLTLVMKAGKLYEVFGDKFDLMEENTYYSLQHDGKVHKIKDENVAAYIDKDVCEQVKDMNVSGVDFLSSNQMLNGCDLITFDESSHTELLLSKKLEDLDVLDFDELNNKEKSPTNNTLSSYSLELSSLDLMPKVQGSELHS